METLRFGFAVLAIICVAFGLVNCDNFNVLDFGAKGDGATDDSKAFLEAWNTACSRGSNRQTIEIPSGKTFLLQPLVFQGPCKSPMIQIQFNGNIVAPSNKGAWSSCTSNRWIGFYYVYGLTVVGSKSGMIDGRGSSFWKDISNSNQQQILTPNEGNSGKCDWPTALHFHACDNLKIIGITSINSPRNHMSLSGCNEATVSNVKLLAPEDSPNTDGIDLSTSTHVNILDSYIGTGDDCVAINTGCSKINITGVKCGPGHGISVGSLGAKGTKGTVEDVRVSYCTFNKTTNGARIKTWPGGQGYARNINYEHITLIDTKNPIIIDQHYGSHNNGGIDSDEKSAVAISDVKFMDFRGTTSYVEAIKLDCSKVTRCNDVVVDKVNIATADGKQPKAVCHNVNGESHETVPVIPCLSAN